jgi:sugar phosphate isomerase/epimerase
MKPFKVGIDSYGLKPLQFSPFEVLDWVLINNGDGVQFAEVNLSPEQAADKTFLRELSQYASENKLYLEWGGGEHIPLDFEKGVLKDIALINRKAAEQANLLGVSIVRSCSGGLMRWQKDSLPAEDFLRMMAKSLKEQRQMFQDLRVVLAIETHFEFTTFELLRLFEMCGAEPTEYLGICLDTMNLLTMLEDPVRATQRILPWVVSTHIKDGALLLTETGFVSFPVETGKGVVNLKEIFELLSSLEHEITLSIEDHGGEFQIPIFDAAFLEKFPGLSVAELGDLLELSVKSQKLLDEGKISVLERLRWPEHCESRMKAGIQHIKKIVRENR